MHKDTIFYISIQDGSVIRYYGKEFIESEIRNPKKLFIGSRILYQDLITHTIKLSKAEVKNNLSMLVEMKMYEDVGLSFEKQYKIGYVVKDDTDMEDGYLIDAYAIDISKLEERFSSYVKKAGHIDFLALPFLSYSALYENGILKKANDIFINITKDEAFAAFYKDGKYIASKSLPTLSNICDELKKYSRYNLNEEELKEVLLKKGLKQENYEPDEYDLLSAIETVMSNIFTKIGNIAIHNRSIYGVEKIDRIFFGIDDESIDGLEEYLNLFENRDISFYRHSFFKTSKKYNQLDLISAVYIYNKAKLGDDSDNVTIFRREKPFFKTQLGKFIGFAAAMFLLFSIFPIYKGYLIYNYKKEYESLNQKYLNMQNDTITLRQKVQNLQSKIKSLEKDIQDKNKKIVEIGFIMKEIKKLSPHSEKYTKMLTDINRLLAKYDLQVEEIKEKSPNEISLKIVSKKDNRDSIAKFMQNISESSYGRVDTKEIKGEKDIYTSLVEISQ